MWTQRHRARHAAHLKEIVSWHAVRELAGWLERVDPPQSATPPNPARGAGDHLALAGRWQLAVAPSGHAARAHGLWLVPALDGAGPVERMMRDWARLRRRAVGRKPNPRLAIIDTQTVKCLSVRGPRGFDAAKRTVGRQRVAMVDADGNWLAVAVVSASVQERDTLPALDQGKVAWPARPAPAPSDSWPG
jgi:hypothetical protein